MECERVGVDAGSVEELPPFDPKSKCIKCGWQIPDPVAPPPKVIAGGAVAKPGGGGDDEKAADFVFDIPGQLALPTLYEIRRLDQPDLTAAAAAPGEKKPAAEKKAAPPAAEKKPTGLMYQPPPPPPQPPTVFYCNGLECPWDEEGDGMEEHMHQICDTCGFEWLAKPLG